MFSDILVHRPGHTLIFICLKLVVSLFPKLKNLDNVNLNENVSVTEKCGWVRHYKYLSYVIFAPV